METNILQDTETHVYLKVVLSQLGKVESKKC